MEENMKWKRGLLLLLVAAVLTGCATVPTGPTVMVLPGQGKPFEVFMADDGLCRQWALQQIGGASPGETANQNVASGAVVGTIVGAAIGTAVGAATGDAGAGAAIGAGAGLLGGTAMGSEAAYGSQWQLQRRYDVAYEQCMYAKGNQIPGVTRRGTRVYAPPPPVTGSGAWVTVPGQYANGKWVPEHKVQVPSDSEGLAAPREPASPQPGSDTPPTR